jgi:hypothetical protein
VDSSGTAPRGARTAGWHLYGASTKQTSWSSATACFVVSYPQGPAHAFLAIAPSTTKLLPVVSCHHSSCRDCCLFHSSPLLALSLPSVSKPTRNLKCIHDLAPRRVWLVALTAPVPAIRRPIHDDTTALILTHTHYRPSSKQLHNTTTKWLAP